MIAVALLAAAAAAAPGTAVGVDLSEWEVALGRASVPVGKVRFNIENLGEDGHDFAVRNGAGTLLKQVPELASGGRTTARMTFRSPGRYVLFCSLEGHEDAGMKTRLRVVRPRRR